MEPGTTTITTVDHDHDHDNGGGTAISDVHQDVIKTHILTRLDGATLASASCASSHLHALSTEEQLWREICSSTWPSIDHPRVHHVISSFPGAYRSFFSDSFPLLHHRSPPKQHHHYLAEIISAVDVHYKESLIFSKVQENETKSDWFLCSPFRFDLLGQKESVQTPIRHVGEDQAWLDHLEENLKLSWILIDPTRNRAVNVSSRSPVSVQHHWLTGDVQLRYSTVVSGGEDSSELVHCAVVVTCEGKVGGEMHVREVSMQVEDLEGKHLNGKDSLVILQGAMESGKRKKERKGEGKERFEEFLKMKGERKERKQRRERALDMACIATGLTIFVAFWSFILFR
ncbi:F-box protein At2g27310-like [Quercus lobata]|uniref:F-box domain-containing protein n=1 Tax=Quercus lobata TaxID=97700 RepID=A0A7N2KLW1_QUELO|nr:F-box protein At2g27310-like [Quercus lobata]